MRANTNNAQNRQPANPDYVTKNLKKKSPKQIFKKISQTNIISKKIFKQISKTIPTEEKLEEKSEEKTEETYGRKNGKSKETNQRHNIAGQNSKEKAEGKFGERYFR